MSLDEIKEIIQNPNFDRINALKEHKIKLLEKRKQIDMLLDNVERTLLSVDGGCKMSDKEKFKGFKKSVIDENEKKYGKEIRSKYGDETIDKSNEKFMKMSEEEYNEAEALAKEIIEQLIEAKKIGAPSSKEAKALAELHKKWLCIYWDKYSKEAHVRGGTNVCV